MMGPCRVGTFIAMYDLVVPSAVPQIIDSLDFYGGADYLVNLVIRGWNDNTYDQQDIIGGYIKIGGFLYAPSIWAVRVFCLEFWISMGKGILSCATFVVYSATLLGLT
jgi:hypothetical protein